MIVFSELSVIFMTSSTMQHVFNISVKSGRSINNPGQFTVLICFSYFDCFIFTICEISNVPLFFKEENNRKVYFIQGFLTRYKAPGCLLCVWSMMI